MSQVVVTLGDLDENGLERLPEFPAVAPVAPLDQCAACGEPIPSDFVAQTTRQMLRCLAETAPGQLPDVLCAPCFIVTVGALKRA